MEPGQRQSYSQYFDAVWLVTGTAYSL